MARSPEELERIARELHALLATRGELSHEDDDAVNETIVHLLTHPEETKDPAKILSAKRKSERSKRLRIPRLQRRES